MTEPPTEHAADAPEIERTTLAAPKRSGLRAFFADYFWFILKNVLGWVFMLGSLPVGLAVPGPGGIPLFLIGFALVTFPGKRKLTSRVMRGVPVRVDPTYLTFIVTLMSILLTAGLLAFVQRRYGDLLQVLHLPITVFQLLGVCALAAVVTWLVMRLALWMLNLVLRKLPTLRRKMRPWLKRKGVHLLPPRRKRAPASGLMEDRPIDEILEIDPRYSRRITGLWAVLKPWLKHLFAMTITVWIFVNILRPIWQRWNDPQVQENLSRIDLAPIAVAAIIFASFLFIFRAMTWRYIIARLGHQLPVAAATRIWSTSELARYVPGAILQFVGRVVLVAPYGVRGSVTSVSQILELAVFLLANVLVAVTCLFYFGIKNLNGLARGWTLVAAALIPVLLLLLHPKICYRIINAIMRRLGKPDIAHPLTGGQMLGILCWNVLGLLWQSVAVYLVTRDALGLKPDWWWVVAGAYCLAWCAGFLAVWAPGGIGVRELVFVAAMSVSLPKEVQARLGNPAEQQVILGLLSLLLRCWATAGELILAAIAYATDYRGALGRITPAAPRDAPL